MVAMQTKRSEPGILYAFDAPQFQGSGATRDLVELWDSRQNQSRDDVSYFAKFTNPTTANGKVYASWGDVLVDNNKCSGPTAPSNRGSWSSMAFLARPCGDKNVIVVCSERVN